MCRGCARPSILVLRQKHIEDADLITRFGPLAGFKNGLENHFEVTGYIALKDLAARPCPEHVPPAVAVAFNEGATCVAAQCWNAAGAMFRKCVDLATRALLPEGDVEGLNQRTRRDLGLRLPWLFDHQLLPLDLKDLSTCIKEDGNDAAHADEASLEKADAMDLLDFAEAMLERLYTEPERLRLAEKRRAERRNQEGGD